MCSTRLITSEARAPASVEPAKIRYRGGMRTIRLVALLVQCMAGPLACGGGQASQEAPQSAPGASVVSASPDAGAGSLTGGESSPATTTTALPDAGDGQGVKLAEAHGPAASDAVPTAGHAHEAGRTAADIRALVVARRDDARACYDAALANHPGIEGDIVITWTIDPRGVVGNVSFDSSRSQIFEPALVECLGGVIEKIQFTSSPGGFETKANYPFNFHPRHAKHAQ